LDVLPAYVCCYVLPIEASELFDYWLTEEILCTREG
jgi:hypothetical protein